MTEENSDGFYILPADEGEEEYSLKLSYFNFPKNFVKGKKIDGSSIGDMYHVVFLKESEDSLPEIDDIFEAIFIDPEEYMKTLIGMNIFGCFVKKTENSHKWFEKYLKKTKENIKSFKRKQKNESPRRK